MGYICFHGSWEVRVKEGGKTWALEAHLRFFSSFQCINTYSIPLGERERPHLVVHLDSAWEGDIVLFFIIRGAISSNWPFPPPTLCKSSLFTIYSCRLQYLVETSREKFRHWKALRRPTELECFFQRGKKSANVYVLAYVPKRASWTAHKQLPFRNNKSPCQKSRDRRLRTNNNFALTQQFLSEDLRVLYKH